MHVLLLGFLSIGNLASGANDSLRIEPLWFRAQAINAPLPTIPSSVSTGLNASVRVVLEADVDTAGNVAGVRILDDGHPELSEAAVRVVRNWSFTPFLVTFPNLPKHNRVGRVIFYFKKNGNSTTVVDAAAARLAEERKKRSQVKN